MKDKPKIFLSSTGKDLQWYRNKVEKLCKKLDIAIYRQEDFIDNGQRHDAEEFSKEQMELGCNWFLCIVGYRYGHSVDGSTSVTQAEYEYALELLDQEVYEGVYVLLCEQLEGFSKKDDIRVHATCAEKHPDTYEKQMKFRHKLDDEVLTLFNNRTEFESLLDKLLRGQISGNKQPNSESLLKSYKGLTQSEKMLRNNSKQAIDALINLQHFKDLHFITHQFRFEVLSDVIQSLSDGSTEDTETLEDAEYAVPKYAHHKGHIMFRKQDERLRIFAHQAKQMENEIRAAEAISSTKSLFLEEFKNPEDLISKLNDLVKSVDRILQSSDRRISEFSEKFMLLAEDALNGLQKLVIFGNWESSSPNVKRRWKDELRETRKLRIELVESVRIHALWQKRHTALSKLNTIYSEILNSLKSEEEAPHFEYWVDDFISVLDEDFFEDCAEDPNKLFEELCPNNSGLLDEFSRQEFRNALRIFILNFESFRDSDEKYEVRSSTSSSKWFEQCTAFRSDFDSAFFEIGTSLRERVSAEAQWIDPLYSLLDDVHGCILEQEKFFENNPRTESVNEN